MSIRYMASSATNMPNPIEGNMTVSPDLARFWLDGMNYKHQRKLKQHHVLVLAEEMRQGRFRDKTTINFCRLGGAYHLVNGQHTLAALSTQSSPLRLNVVVTAVSSEAELADEYARHDTHYTRKLSDSLVAHELDVELGVGRDNLNTIVAGALYLARMRGEVAFKAASSLTNDTKLGIARKYGPVGKLALELAYGHLRSSWVSRRTTFATIMLTADRQPSLARDFWPVLLADDGLRLGDPRKTLRNWLSTTTTPTGTVQNRSGKTAAQDHTAVKAIAMAWNAFTGRRELRLIKTSHLDKLVEFDMCEVVTV